MRTTIGSDQPPPLEKALERTALERFTAAMEDLGHRKDRAAMMGTFVGAMAGFPAGVSATIPALRRYLPPQDRITEKQFRNLLNCEGWDPADLRRELVAAGLEGGVEAILIEGYELRENTPQPFDVASAHLLGPGSAIPIGWRRTPLPKKRDGEGPNILDEERRSAVGLLEQYLGDVETLGAAAAAAPVVILDWRCGDDDELRQRLADLGFELLVEVGGEYAGFDQTGTPFGSQYRRPTLFDQLPFAPDGSPPEPRLLRTVNGRHEFVTGLQRPDASTYAIAAPLVDAPPESLQGHRARERAGALAALAARICPSDAATRLRIADLRFPDERPWLAAAYLISAFQATQMARFPKGGS